MKNSFSDSAFCLLLRFISFLLHSLFHLFLSPAFSPKGPVIGSYWSMSHLNTSKNWGLCFVCQGLRFLFQGLCFLHKGLCSLCHGLYFLFQGLSSQRGKRAGPKGLRAESARAVTGRREDFLSRQQDFFTETAVTSKRIVDKSFPRWEINRHAKG